MATVPDFPKLLEKARLDRYQVKWREEDLDAYGDEAIYEYKLWKYYWGISCLTPAKLRAMHARQLYSREIFQVFRKNKRIGYLEHELQRRRRFT